MEGQVSLSFHFSFPDALLTYFIFFSFIFFFFHLKSQCLHCLFFPQPSFFVDFVCTNSYPIHCLFFTSISDKTSLMRGFWSLKYHKETKLFINVHHACLSRKWISTLALAYSIDSGFGFLLSSLASRFHYGYGFYSAFLCHLFWHYRSFLIDSLFCIILYHLNSRLSSSIIIHSHIHRASLFGSHTWIWSTFAPIESKLNFGNHTSIMIPMTN
jgi:hypothetical protein